MRGVRRSVRKTVVGTVGGSTALTSAFSAVLSSVHERGARRRGRAQLLSAATTCVEEWRWPVVPAAGARGADSGCGCPRPDCPTPGAHPFDPPLLAATTDARMVRWWWQQRPDAPVVVATGGPVSAVSLPIGAGRLALGYFDALRVRVGPVIATPTRCVLLVAPYTMQELAELLVAQEWVPTSLRFHGTGGFVLLPPSRTGAGALQWLRGPDSPEPEPVAGVMSTAFPGTGVAPADHGGAPWLPKVGTLLEALVAASAAAPDGARLAY